MSAYELPSIAANLFNHEIPQFFIFELEEYEDLRSLYVEINRYKELCCHELIVNVNKNCQKLKNKPFIQALDAISGTICLLTHCVSMSSMKSNKQNIVHTQVARRPVLSQLESCTNSRQFVTCHTGTSVSIQHWISFYLEECLTVLRRLREFFINVDGFIKSFLIVFIRVLPFIKSPALTNLDKKLFWRKI